MGLAQRDGMWNLYRALTIKRKKRSLNRGTLIDTEFWGAAEWRETLKEAKLYFKGEFSLEDLNALIWMDFEDGCIVVNLSLDSPSFLVSWGQEGMWGCETLPYLYTLPQSNKATCSGIDFQHWRRCQGLAP